MGDVKALDEARRLADEFESLLIAMAGERDQHREVVETAHGPEMAWTLHERVAMWSHVNALRGGRGKSPVDLEAVARIDRYHTGHVDWCRKFAFECALLVVKGDG